MDWSPPTFGPANATPSTPVESAAALFYPQFDLFALTVRLEELCQIKLQQASQGRHQSLRRQLQLQRMLTTMRDAHKNARPTQVPFSSSFDQDLFSPSPSTSGSLSLDALRSFDWDSDALGSDQQASALLLSMGASAYSTASSQEPSPDLDPSLSSQPTENEPSTFHLGSLSIPYSTDFSTNLSPQSQAFISDLTGISPLASFSGPSYYQLLMAANPNEPLSQLLMSTTATSITSPTFNISSALESSMGNNFSAVSNPTMDTPSPIFNLAGFSLDSASDTQQPDPQQTVAMTTKEIMDALSGQLPIQPKGPTSDSPSSFQSVAVPVEPVALAFPPTVAESSEASEESEAVESLDVTPTERTVEESTRECDSADVAKDSETMASVVVALPLRDPFQDEPQTQEDDNHRPELNCVLASPEAISALKADVERTLESMEVDIHLDVQEMTLTSPPPSPSKSKRRRAAKATAVVAERRSTRMRNKARGSNLMAVPVPEPVQEEESTMEAPGVSFTARLSSAMLEGLEDKADSLRFKRRRTSEDSACSSTDSSPESWPLSPRTPPPLHETEDRVGSSLESKGGMMPLSQDITGVEMS